MKLLKRHKVTFLIIIISFANVFAAVSRNFDQEVKTPEIINLRYSLSGDKVRVIIQENGKQQIEEFKIDKNKLTNNIFEASGLLDQETEKEKLIKVLSELYDALFLEIDQFIPKDKMLCFQVDKYLQDVPFHLLFHDAKFLMERNYVFYMNDHYQEHVSDTINQFSYEELKSNETTIYSDQAGLEINNALEIGSIPTLSEKCSVEQFKTTLGTCKSIYITTHGEIKKTDDNKYYLKFEDKMIESYEIARFNNSCEFIFVNACNSASRDILPNSLSTIGVKTVIGSMWKNPSIDRATANVIRRFYRNWRNGMTKVEALISAQRETLEKERLANDNASDNYRKGGDHPHYWGAFVLIGDYR